MSSVQSSVLNPQSQGIRQSARQTRTNPSRTSKTIGRSSFGFGRGSTAEIPPTPPVPHGFYPALTHFTDAITALPREFRRHNSLLKEVDAKAWALEENLLQLLKYSSESQPVPHPPHPAPIVGGVVREDVLPKDLPQSPESAESKNRRLLFDRVRQSLSDLMMTADEKNHVISNANEELDRQIVRLDTVFPYIAGEISEEARLGSLSHWAYSNKNAAAKAATNERPRREAVSQRHDLTHALQEAEAASRSEARREAVLARKQRRTNVDADYEDTRGARKTTTGKSRGDNAAADQGAAPKRRKVVDRSAAVDMGAPMERSASGTGSQRASNKDGAEKKRSRAPNPNAAAARKKYVPCSGLDIVDSTNLFLPTRTTAASNAGSPILAPSPLVGTFNTQRGAASPGPNPARPQSSRAQQNAGQTGNSRQRPSSSASNRVNQSNPTKPSDPRSNSRDGLVKNEVAIPDPTRDPDGDANGRISVPAGTKREDTNRPADVPETESAAKGRNSKTSTPVLATFAEPTQPRARPTRSTDPAPKRTAKKPLVQAAIPSDEESIHEGDDEDEEGEPRYCYCNEISFGEMVACDNDACPREWFHLSCVGLTKPPGKNVKWYCNECKQNMRPGRNGR
ncbi:Zinc finger PHD-finger [Penicillium macrosclerotiorum]|uniref:Zinc finger PHD-finger n=1 Tax=Penicillium macrosclerotiorum TaxID=303699 RepID=UPI0025467C33|nr:Zinc finger PHD-finger [Penicillium macrosclerotiorum]KAJ5679494.1 Zinc finger PHD-finger [Penicillium macrosclerotiorum]